MPTAMPTKIFRACHIFVDDAAATFDREQVNELLSFAPPCRRAGMDD
jgi:hypothetical protein